MRDFDIFSPKLLESLLQSVIPPFLFNWVHKLFNYKNKIYLMSNFRESTYSLNMRPSFDPVRFPTTVNTGEYFQSYPLS